MYYFCTVCYNCEKFPEVQSLVWFQWMFTTSLYFFRELVLKNKENPVLLLFFMKKTIAIIDFTLNLYLLLN